MAYIDTLNKNSTDYALSAFGNVFVNTESASSAKTIDYSNRGFNESTDSNLVVKVVFTNGQTSSDTSTNMTLNGHPILVNQYETLIPIPVNTVTEGGSTVYRTLQANTTLEMYYTKSVSGYSSGAYVVVGNPVVISNSDYTIYADGHKEYSKHAIDALLNTKVKIANYSLGINASDTLIINSYYYANFIIMGIATGQDFFSANILCENTTVVRVNAYHENLLPEINCVYNNNKTTITFNNDTSYVLQFSTFSA